MDNRDDIPIGDVVDASIAFGKIDELLRQIPVTSRDTSFQLSGAKSTMSRTETEKWVEESNAEGFSRIRFILHRAPGGKVLVELSAAT